MIWLVHYNTYKWEKEKYSLKRLENTNYIRNQLPADAIIQHGDLYKLVNAIYWDGERIHSCLGYASGSGEKTEDLL